MNPDNNELLEQLLEKPYRVIDILPVQVEKDQAGQYFRIDDYYRQSEQYVKIRTAFLNVLLKLNCYYDLDYQSLSKESWIRNPEPKDLFRSYLKGDFNILIDKEETLITMYDDDTYMTVYNSSDTLNRLLKQLCESEGLFLR